MKYIMISGLIVLFGCTGCLDKLYSVHEPSKKLDIPVDSKYNKQKIVRLIDSINAIYRNNSCDYPSMLENEGRRLVFLVDCEGYLVYVRNKKISVVAIYNENYSKEWWLTTERQVDDSLLLHTQTALANAFQ